MITIIGRGHSGTRAASHTLTASGVFMGAPLNGSGDLVPPESMYEACRVFSKYVSHIGGLKWDFSKALGMDPDPAFVKLITEYLASVLESESPNRGWKIPETTLVYPWIVKMFPDIKYIYWVRDPRDCIVGGHITDDLGSFGVPYERTSDARLMRAISWKYQSEIFKATPRPEYLLDIRFEDFVLRQPETLAVMEEFLGVPLDPIAVRPEAVGRWKADAGRNHFDFFDEEISKYGYGTR